MTTPQVFPLQKNDRIGVYEALMGSTHIVVTFSEFEAEMKHLISSYKGENTSLQTASNKAYFELIDATRWNDGHHTCGSRHDHTCGTCAYPPQEQGGPFTFTIDFYSSAEDGERVPSEQEQSDAVLEAMETYFFGLYENAEKESEQEARGAEVYTHIVHTRTLGRIERLLGQLVDTSGVGLPWEG